MGVIRSGPLLPLAVRRVFWERVRFGDSVAEASAAAGVSRDTGTVWIRDAGGVNPYSTDVVAGRYLSLAERELIAEMRQDGDGVRVIATALGRSPSTVSRELKRNLTTAGHGRHRERYRPGPAQRQADLRSRRPKTTKLADCPRLAREVQRLLTLKYSPEQVSGRLKVGFPEDERMRVSHETIYQELYIHSRGALKRDLVACLRTGRAVRRPRRSAADRRNRIPDKTNISERPEEADELVLPGHWEGDLITGIANKSAIGTIVERVTGYVLLLHLPDRHGAAEVEKAIVKQMGKLPAALRKSLTWDQGIEMSNHADIAIATDLDIYFCDPHSPWQRGRNENTNGLLRQYFPKSTDLSGYHPDYLDFVSHELNIRARKRLGYKAPAEVLDELLSTPLNPGVATTP